MFSVDVIHYVADRPRYFRGVRRLLRPGGKVCTVTDSERIIRDRRPLAVYFPETVGVELARYPTIPELRGAMAEAGFRDLCEETVEPGYQISDIQAYRDRAFSSLHLISEEAFRRGIERMERDLGRGAVEGVSRYALLWCTR